LICSNAPVGILSQFLLSNFSILITVQPDQAGKTKLESLISLDLSQNIALSNLSSGDNSVSHLGVTFQTRILDAVTRAHTLTIQSGHKSFNFSVHTFGISSVVDSGHNLVSRTSIEYS